MESLGKYLKNERVALNISLEDISKFTKIREGYLKAIEEERFDLLPPSFYVKGYLKTYAKYLGLDSKDVIIKYQSYLERVVPPPIPDLPNHAISLKKGFRSWSIFFLAFGAWVAILLIFSFSRNDPIGEERKIIQTKGTSQSVSQADVNTPYLWPEGGNQSSNQEVNEIGRDVLPAGPEVSLLPEEKLAPVGESKEIPLQYENGLNGLEILEASLGTGIERTGLQQFLIGKCSYFFSNHQRAYFFTRIKSNKPAQIFHIWLWEGREYHRIEMEVKPPLWSVYSYLTFHPYHVGNWRSEIREGDQVLASLNFKVIPSSENQTELRPSLQYDSADSNSTL